jgi:hypothetical protein
MEGLKGAQRHPRAIGKTCKLLFESIIPIATGSRPNFVESARRKLELLRDAFERSRYKGLNFLGKKPAKVMSHFIRGAPDDR